MMTVEVTTRPGTLTAGQREELGRRLLTELIAEESAPEAVLDGARTLTNVVAARADHVGDEGRRGRPGTPAA